MKKIALVVFIILSLTAVSLFTAGKEKKKDPLENLCLVEKVEPAPEKVKKGFDSITAADAEAYLRFLSSDLLEGRGTATDTYSIAAEFAATLFRVWGLDPGGDRLRNSSGSDNISKRSYFQEVQLRKILERESEITITHRLGTSFKTKILMQDSDYWYLPKASFALSTPLVFVGYGISEKSLGFDEYKGINVKGKVVLMLDGLPQWDKKDSAFKIGKLEKKYRQRRGRGHPKIEQAEAKGAAAVVLVRSRLRGSYGRKNDEKAIIPWKELPFFSLEGVPPRANRTKLPIIYIYPEMANSIVEMSGESLPTLQEKIDSELKPRSRQLAGISIKLESKIESEPTQCRNVLALIEGSDPELKKEVVIIGAHMDHFGKLGEYIFNGADDNGSGSVGVLELAQAFAENPVKPKRSLLFALWTGEERGGLGSRTYVHKPTYPLEKTTAYLNLDMISRTWEKEKLLLFAKRRGLKIDEETLEKIEVERVITASIPVEAGELLNTVRNSNHPVGMSIYIKKDGSPGGSDHAIFARKDVPWIFFFAGFSEEFHTPADSVDKVSFDMIRDISRLTYLTAFALADSAAK